MIPGSDADHAPTSFVPGPGNVPGLQTRVIAGGNGVPRTFALVSAKGNEVMPGLTD